MYYVMGKRLLKMIAVFVLFSFMLIGCAPTIQLAVDRPPNLNTSGIKRIAVMPFESNGGSGSADIARYATTVAGTKIREMNYFTLVDPAVIIDLRKDNQSIESHVDALFVGQITRVASGNDTYHGSYKNKKGEMVYYTDYITEVELEFNYYLSRARDGKLIGPISKRGRDRASDNDGYPSPSGLLRRVVDKQLRNIGRDLAPYKSIEYRTFATDNTKDEALKAEMKSAISLVKAGSYKVALKKYLDIYERYQSLAAAENASILYEALGEVQSAAELMKKAYDDTGNPKAQNVLARLNKIIQDQATLASDYDDSKGGQKEKVMAVASEEIRSVLPAKAVVWIYNNSPGNDIVNGIVDNLTADFILKGIRLVDREQQSGKLIEAEQIHQRSGAVSDDDIVRIGHAAGANIIVFVGITGTGAMRRLQIRALDIKTRTPILQSDTGEKWQL